MKVKSESEVAQTYPTLSDPMDCSLPGSSIPRIFQARVLEWGAIAFSSCHTSHISSAPQQLVASGYGFGQHRYRTFLSLQKDLLLDSTLLKSIKDGTS